MTGADSSRRVPAVWILVALLGGFAAGTIAAAYEGDPLHGTDWWIAGSSLLVAGGTGWLAWQTRQMVRAARDEGSATARLAAGAEMDRSAALTALLRCDEKTATGAALKWAATIANGTVWDRDPVVPIFNLGRGNAERVAVWINLQAMPDAAPSLVAAGFRYPMVPPSVAEPTELPFDPVSSAVRSEDVPILFGGNAVDRATAVILWMDGRGYMNRSRVDGTGLEQWRPGGEGEPLVLPPDWTIFFQS